VEYQWIVAATERQFTDEERDIEARQAEVDTVQALLDRRRRTLRRNRNGFSKMVEGWRTLDVEVATGKSSRSDAADEGHPGCRRWPTAATLRPRRCWRQRFAGTS
jgi:hypothetical protein